MTNLLVRFKICCGQRKMATGTTRQLFLLASLLLAGFSRAASFNPHSYGAVGNGTTDDTSAILKTIAAAHAAGTGSVVAFSAGTYLYSKTLSVDSLAVTGAGIGATTLLAADPANSSLMLTGTNPSVAGLTITTRTPATQRNTKPAATGIHVFKATGFTIDNVRIARIASAGILVRQSAGASGGYAEIQNCEVSNTLADGIHLTLLSHSVEVHHNTVQNTGDDLIAVVSYRSDGGTCDNINIHDNQVHDQTNGRGISVVGGSNVVIQANTIARSSGAGIYLVSESSYDTYGDTNIQVLHNILSALPVTESLGHGAIMLLGRAAPDSSGVPLAISHVTIDGNQIDDCGHSGLFLGAYSSDVTVTGNLITNAAACGISIYGGATDIKITPGATGSTPNTITSCGEYGIQVDPANSTGVLQIVGVHFSAVNTKNLNFTDVINIGRSGTFDSMVITDNQLTQPADLSVKQFLNSLSPVTTVARNTANVTLGNTYTLASTVVKPTDPRIKIQPSH
jgi:hypothetical protein